MAAVISEAELVHNYKKALATLPQDQGLLSYRLPNYTGPMDDVSAVTAYLTSIRLWVKALRKAAHYRHLVFIHYHRDDEDSGHRFAREILEGYAKEGEALLAYYECLEDKLMNELIDVQWTLPSRIRDENTAKNRQIKRTDQQPHASAAAAASPSVTPESINTKRSKRAASRHPVRRFTRTTSPVTVVDTWAEDLLRYRMLTTQQLLDILTTDQREHNAELFLATEHGRQYGAQARQTYNMPGSVPITILALSLLHVLQLGAFINSERRDCLAIWLRFPRDEARILIATRYLQLLTRVGQYANYNELPESEQLAPEVVAGLLFMKHYTYLAKCCPWARFLLPELHRIQAEQRCFPLHLVYLLTKHTRTTLHYHEEIARYQPYIPHGSVIVQWDEMDYVLELDNYLAHTVVDYGGMDQDMMAYLSDQTVRVHQTSSLEYNDSLWRWVDDRARRTYLHDPINLTELVLPRRTRAGVCWHFRDIPPDLWSTFVTNHGEIWSPVTADVSAASSSEALAREQVNPLAVVLGEFTTTVAYLHLRLMCLAFERTDTLPDDSSALIALAQSYGRKNHPDVEPASLYDLIETIYRILYWGNNVTLPSTQIRAMSRLGFNWLV